MRHPDALLVLVVERLLVVPEEDLLQSNPKIRDRPRFPCMGWVIENVVCP